MQREEPVLLGGADPERVRVERAGSLDVRYREAAECLGIAEHVSETVVADQTHRSADELLVAGLLGVLETDTGVEAPAGCIFDQHPRRFTVAVLQDGSLELRGDG